jgi:tetratricopeptide (TPR) repeat protein
VAIRAYEFNYARRLLSEAEDIGERVRSLWMRSWVPQQEAIIEELSGNIDRATEHYKRSINKAIEGEIIGDQAFGFCYLGNIVASRGNFEEANVLVDKSIRAADIIRFPRTQIVTRLTRATLHLRCGQVKEARSCREELASRRFTSLRLGEGALAYCDALINLSSGKPLDAVAHFKNAARLLSGHTRFWRDCGVVLYAHAALLCEQRELAQTALQMIESHPAFPKNPSKQCSAQLIRGLILYAANQVDEAKEELDSVGSDKVTNELAALRHFALAWISLDRRDLGSFSEHSVMLAGWIDETPWGALLCAWHASIINDKPALESIRRSLEARAWTETSVGSKAAAICGRTKSLSDKENVERAPMLLPI